MSEPFGGPGATGQAFPQARPYPPWRIWEAVLVVALFAVSQPLLSVLGSVVLGPLLAPGLSPQEAEDELMRAVLPLVIGVSHAVGWLALYVLIVRRYGMAFLAGLRLGSLQRFRMARIFGAGMALQVVGVLLAALMPPPEELASPMMRFLTFGRWALALLFVLAVILAPLLEESLFRGVLLPALRKRMAFQPAALLVTVLFAALHGVQTGGYLPALVVIALAGYVMAYLREASGALWPPILFHMGFNFTALLPVLLLGERVPEGYPGVL